MSERALKGMFLKPEKLQNHSNEGNGKEKEKELGEGKKEKRKKQFINDSCKVFTLLQKQNIHHVPYWLAWYPSLSFRSWFAI